MNDEIIEALEATAPVRKDRGQLGAPAVGDKADTILWRDKLLLFLGNIDDGATVYELRNALEDYS